MYEVRYLLITFEPMNGFTSSFGIFEIKHISRKHIIAIKLQLDKSTLRQPSRGSKHDFVKAQEMRPKLRTFSFRISAVIFLIFDVRTCGKMHSIYNNFFYLAVFTRLKSA